VHASPLLYTDPLGLFAAPSPCKEDCDIAFPEPVPDVKNEKYVECIADCQKQYPGIDPKSMKKKATCIAKCLVKLPINISDDIKKWVIRTTCCYAHAGAGFTDCNPCKCNTEQIIDCIGRKKTVVKCLNPLDDVDIQQLPSGQCSACCQFQACVDAFSSLSGDWKKIIKMIGVGTINVYSCMANCGKQTK
jgi:hypothetical protein